MMSGVHEYRAHHTLWSWHSLMALGCAVMTWGAMLGFRESPIVSVLGVLMFGFMTVVLAYPIVTRAVAITVDDRGVGFGDGTIQPWSEITSVRIERSGRHRVVALRFEQWEETDPDEVDEDDPEPGWHLASMQYTHKAISGWRLDESRFWPVVNRYLPSKDLDTSH